jgi:penicillin-binding protein 2
VLSLIRMVFVIAAIAILARLAWIQRTLPDDYLSVLTGTTVEYEWLPARDGRILAENTVLAVDEEHFLLQLHYRWLQAEPDPDWLQRQIRQQLTREERRNPELLNRTEHKLRQQRRDLRRELAIATGLSEDELAARLAAIETRVQRISDSVNRRASATNTDEDAGDEENRPGWLMQSLASIRDALTTPPQRDDEPRIVVREEEAWHTVLEEIPRDVAGQLSEDSHRFPGVRVLINTRRQYLQPDLAAHVIGARTPRIDQELAVADDAAGLIESAPDEAAAGASRSQPSVAPGPAPGVRMGRFGIERSYHSQLAGVPGLTRIVRDRRQRVVKTELLREPVSGRDLTVTLNAPLQTVAEQLLAESLGDAERTLLAAPADSPDQDPASSDEPALPPEPEFIPTGGCVLVMEAATGRLLVAASAPDFDLTMFTDGSPAQWSAVNGDTRRPFVARFTGMALPPGSTFKILTAIAGLESGTIHADEPFDCRGYLTTPDKHRCLVYRLHGKGHGPVTLQSALAQSCNVYFFDAAQRMGLGPLMEWSDKLEFGRPTGIDLPFEKSGTLPAAGTNSPASAASSQRRFEREALGMAIGQSRLTVTPLQLARLVACVANDGWLVTPHVVSDEGTVRQAGDHDTSPYPIRRHRVAGLSSDTLAAIRAGMADTVSDPHGTGFRTVRLPEVEVAGKTGTAENAPGKPDHAWFAGYAPADSPRYVIVVALEHGGSGSRAAGPVVREVVRAMHTAGLL